MAISPSDYKYDAFISYRRGDPDQAFARDILKKLEADGYRCAMDARDFVSNIPFLTEMERRVKESRFTVCIISPRFLDSGNCAEEAIICKVLDMGQRKRRLLPLIRDRVDMPVWLYDITGIDTTEADPLIAWYDKLARDIGPPMSSSLASPDPPGTEPERHWNVPHERNPFFTGREGILLSLHDSLNNGSAAAITQPQAISGLGGIGKTQTAVEYAYRFRDEYRAAFWDGAETEAALIAGFVDIAAELDLPGVKIAEQSVAVEGAKRWLEANDGWCRLSCRAI